MTIFWCVHYFTRLIRSPTYTPKSEHACDVLKYAGITSLRYCPITVADGNPGARAGKISPMGLTGRGRGRVKVSLM